jgi:hypothetical protein
VSAKEAMDAIRFDIAAFKTLLKCVKKTGV